MAHRTTILLDDETFDRLKRRAANRGTSVSEEVREAVAAHRFAQPPSAGWLLGLGAELTPHEREQGGPLDYDHLDEEIGTAAEADYAAAKASFDRSHAAR